jgi:hypothetical protein
MNAVTRLCFVIHLGWRFYERSCHDSAAAVGIQGGAGT